MSEPTNENTSAPGGFAIGTKVVLRTTGETGHVVAPRHPEEYKLVGKNAIPVEFDDDESTVWYVPARKLDHA